MFALGVRGVASTSSQRFRPLCPKCHLPFPTSPFRPLPFALHLAHHRSYSTPPREQVQRYLEQARLSIQAAIRTLREHQGKLAVSLGTRVDGLGSRLNHVTGYEDIDRLKAAVVATGESTSTTELMIEQQLTSARDAAKALKHAYDQAVTTRASAQRSVNSLLERKDRWSDSDVADFTSLIRSDHASNAAVAQTSAQLNAAEADVDRLFSELTKTILTRYHEEQIWSDKIRSFSSWANLVGLAVNLVVFVGAIAFVEPWKRRKLAEGLEGRMAGMMESVQKQIEALAGEVGERNLSGRAASLPLQPEAFDQPPLAPTEIAIPPVHAVQPSASTSPYDYTQYLNAGLNRCYHYLGGADHPISVEPVYLASVSGLALGAAITYILR